MAQGLLACRLAQRNYEVEVASAGVAALIGHSANSIARDLMNQRGIDISSHSARQLTPEMLTYFDLILVMEAGHLDVVRSMSPAAYGKTHRLGKWIDKDIPDPYGKSRASFEQSLKLIDEATDSWLAKLWK